MSEEPTPTPEPAQPVEPTPTVKKPKRIKPPTRGERFANAADSVMTAVGEARDKWEEAKAAYEQACEVYLGLKDDFEGLVQNISDSLEELKGVREEFEDWLSNMPDGLRDGPTGEKLQVICDIDLDPEMPQLPEPEELQEPDFDSIENAAQECLDADLPLGFGRD